MQILGQKIRERLGRDASIGWLYSDRIVYDYSALCSGFLEPKSSTVAAVWKAISHDEAFSMTNVCLTANQLVQCFLALFHYDEHVPGRVASCDRVAHETIKSPGSRLELFRKDELGREEL